MLLWITFIPVSRMFDSEDDIFIFSGMFENPAPAKYNLKKRNKKYYEISTIKECVQKESMTIGCNI